MIDADALAELANPGAIDAIGGLIQIQRDREAVEDEGLAAFVRAAWPQVDPAPLQWNWHHEVICDRLERVTRGEIRFLLVNVPPGTTKTTICSILWPAWQWIDDPTHAMITASYGDVILDAARKQRDLINSDWFQARWPHVSIPYQNTKAARFFRNNRGGLRFSTTVGGAMTGYHGLTLMADDLNKAQAAMGGAAYTMVELDAAWDCWEKVMVTRRTDPARVRRVYVAQRLHERDVPGRWREKYGDEIHVVCLPMHRDSTHPDACPPTDEERGIPGDDRKEGELLWPEHIPASVVAELEMALGPGDASAQLEQRPVPEGGAVFKREWFTQFFRSTHLGLEWKGVHPRWLQSWDLNVDETSDGSFVSGGVWAQTGSEVYRVAGVRGRWEFTVAADRLVDLVLDYPESAREVVIEKKANADALASFLRRYYRDECAKRGVKNPPTLEIKLVTPKGSKLARANGVTGIVSGGHIHLPEDAPWLGGYLDELLRFTGRGAEADDQVDETTQLLTYLYGTQSERWAEAMERARAHMRRSAA